MPAPSSVKSSIRIECGTLPSIIITFFTPLLIASILCDFKHYDSLKDLGYHLGIAFQMVDDLMDVEGTLESIGKTPNKDKEENKLTSIKVFGIDGVRERIKYHHGKCNEILSKIDNSGFLIELSNAMAVRKK